MESFLLFICGCVGILYFVVIFDVEGGGVLYDMFGLLFFDVFMDCL